MARNYPTGETEALKLASCELRALTRRSQECLGDDIAYALSRNHSVEPTDDGQKVGVQPLETAHREKCDSVLTQSFGN